MSISMYDSIDVSNLPAKAAAYAGYVNGRYNTWAALVAGREASGAQLLSIDVFGTGFAHCLDVESGDATNAQIETWFKRVKAAGVKVPVIYTSASNVQAVINICMETMGLKRTEFLIWSAHYTGQPHICAPAICGYPAADATQWTDAADGCDESLVADYFFPWTLGSATPPASTPAPPPASAPYPAPKNVGVDKSVVALNWTPVTDGGKLILNYTIQVVQLNGTVAQTHTVTQPGIILTGLNPSWQYNVNVWANGGPSAPPHATFRI